jgi:hypothetical protein
MTAKFDNNNVTGVTRKKKADGIRRHKSCGDNGSLVLGPGVRGE